MRILRSQLDAQRNQLPAGFADEFLSKAVGTAVPGGPPQFDQWLSMPDADYKILRLKYWPGVSSSVREAIPPPSSSRVRGLGTVVAAVAKPIARAIDKVAGTNLRNCGGCRKREETLNKILPFSKP